MANPDDTSGEHFDWLVEGRSHNQRSTVRLYRIIEDNRTVIELAPTFERLARDLAAIAFSLWRAVFLTDLTGEVGDQLADLTRFLRSLLAHNTVLYQTDFNSREWAFTYYLENALFRLRRIAPLASTGSMNEHEFDRATFSAKNDWSNAQNALDHAISNFAKALASHDPA